MKFIPTIAAVALSSASILQVSFAAEQHKMCRPLPQISYMDGRQPPYSFSVPNDFSLTDHATQPFRTTATDTRPGCQGQPTTERVVDTTPTLTP